MREDSRRSERITSANRSLGTKDLKLIKKFGNILHPNVAKEKKENVKQIKEN